MKRTVFSTFFVWFLLCGCKGTPEVHAFADPNPHPAELPKAAPCGFTFEQETDPVTVASELKRIHGLWVSDSGKRTSIRPGVELDPRNRSFRLLRFDFASATDSENILNIHPYERFNSARLSQPLDWPGHPGFRVIQFFQPDAKPDNAACVTYAYAFPETEKLLLLPGKNSLGTGPAPLIATYLKNIRQPESPQYRYRIYAR